MRKCTLFFLLSIIFSLHTLSQNQYSIKYDSDKQNVDIEALMALLDIYSLNIKLDGQLKGKKISLVEHVVKMGEATSKTIFVFNEYDSDKFDARIVSRAVDSDSVKIIINTDAVTFKRNHRLKNAASYDLLETYQENEALTDIPFFAFTTGIAKRFNRGGNIFDGYDVCGLRDSKTHPSEWYKKYNIPHYVYYTIKID